MSFEIVEIRDAQVKSDCARDILTRLPRWFGNVQARDEYVEKVRELPFFAAADGEGRLIGFFALNIHYDRTGEIVVCGVHPDCRGMGAGKALCRAAEAFFRENGCRYMIVKTLSDRVSHAPYAETRAFYASVGFEPLITLTEMWDAENPCLIMIKTLEA